MRHLHLQPTETDVAIAGLAARHATPRRERLIAVLTWLADEKILYAASAAAWLIAKNGNRRERLQADHLVLTVVLANVLPHLLKQVVDQERPDRTVMPPRHGIPKSGNPYDAFPSGHAMHIGAIASAMSRMYPKACGWIWLGGLAVASTRIALLAHWTSDVVAGLAAGVSLERLMRPMDGRVFAARKHRRMPR